MKPKPFKFFFAAVLGIILFFFVARVLFGALLIAAALTIGFYFLKFVKQLFHKGAHSASVWEDDRWAKVDRIDADLYDDTRIGAFDQTRRTTIEIY